MDREQKLGDGPALNESEFYGATAAEWLRRWDAGETVWTLEMGGLGPGYEQVIHIACAEVVRDMLNEPVPDDGDEHAAAREAWSAKADKALHRADKFPGMGMSGAQAGAARQLAFQIIKRGPAGFIAWIKAEHPERASDLIQVDRCWPRPAALNTRPLDGRMAVRAAERERQMGMMTGSSVRVRDDRPATEKADGLANKVGSVLARLNDLNARLGTHSDLKSVKGDGYSPDVAPPRPTRLLHDALEEASVTVDRINEMLDSIGQRL